ncbi:MAG: hypothetical protein JW822_11600 [Spirochaetales bacterium]|nr:hypothetical protein [Spirochaetales bacterium]
MKSVRIWILFLLFLGTAVSLICSEEIVHEQGKISIWYPDHWTMKSDEDALMIADPDEEVVFVYMLIESDEIEDALAALEEELLSTVTELQSVGEPEEDKLNGMDCLFMEAQGKIDDMGVDIGVFMVFTPAQKVLLVMGIVQSSAYEKHEETIVEILSGIQPL